MVPHMNSTICQRNMIFTQEEILILQNIMKTRKYTITHKFLRKFENKGLVDPNDVRIIMWHYKMLTQVLIYGQGIDELILTASDKTGYELQNMLKLAGVLQTAGQFKVKHKLLKMVHPNKGSK